MSYWIALIAKSVVLRRSSARNSSTPCSASRTDCARSRSSCLPRSIRTSGSRRSSRIRTGPCRSGQFLADFGAREAGEFPEAFGIAGDEERGVAGLEAELRCGSLGPLRADVVGERACPPSPPSRQNRCSRAPAGPRPAPRNSSGRRRRGRRRRRNRPDRVLGVFQHRANTLKPEPRKCSETSCMTIGLRRSGLSVPYLRIASA
jgi:hypothetical protein